MSNPLDISTVEVGDVLMVARETVNLKTNKLYTWRYFMVVTKIGVTRVVGLRIGAEEGKEKITTRLMTDDVVKLEPDEWPDGVCASRMMLILEGKIDDLI